VTPALLDMRLRLRSDVVLGEPLLSGPELVYRVKDLRSGRAFEVSAREHFIMNRLDGAHSLNEIGTEYAAAFGRRLGVANWQQLVALLASRELLASPAGSPAQSPPTAPVIEPVFRFVRPALSRWVVGPLVALAVALQVYLAAHLGELTTGLLWLLHRPLLLLAVLCVVWFSAALHEVGHALAARRFGCPVKISVLTLHCRVDSYLYLRSRAQRLVIAGAGGLTNALLLVPFAVVWVALPPSATPRPAIAGLLLIGSAQTLLNFVPIPPFDGYKMLGHAIGVTHLATHSRRFLHRVLGRAVGRGPGVGAYPRRARVVYATYGLAGVGAMAATATGIVLLCRHLIAERFGGPGVVIAIVALTMTVAGWLARPATTPNSTNARKAESHE
jgi:putative peptide zinc metalloprotease protein